ncbi:heart- and neural crest derivatives-expressed protein 2-like [Glandiceps talaboti]
MSIVGGYMESHPMSMPLSNDCSYHHTNPYPEHDGRYYQSWILNGGEMSPSDYNLQSSPCNYEPSSVDVPRPRFGKRRNTANKKERRRTQSINGAFSDLRDCIPNVPADTKLSKIKTLRLATSYISYLMDLLGNDDPNQCIPGGFRAEFKKIEKKEETIEEMRPVIGLQYSNEKRGGGRGRTGWPQYVWALELKQ